MDVIWPAVQLLVGALALALLVGAGIGLFHLFTTKTATMIGWIAFLAALAIWLSWMLGRLVMNFARTKGWMP